LRLLTSLSPTVSINGVISIYRGYRDWWTELERRQPGVAMLLRVVGVMVGVFLGALLTHSLDVWILAAALIGATIGAGWTGFRRRPGRGRTN
jgi:uncharacterized membrane protein YfcA